jgi:hypothetical protein
VNFFDGRISRLPKKFLWVQPTTFYKYRQSLEYDRRNPASLELIRARNSFTINFKQITHEFPSS